MEIETNLLSELRQCSGYIRQVSYVCAYRAVAFNP